MWIMRIIGFHLADKILVNSDGESCSEDYLGFLLKDKGECIKVFYSLDWAVARLCYLLNLTEKQLRSLWSTGNLYANGYKLFYVPHRYFGLSYGKHWGEASFSDIFQFNVDLSYDVEPLDAAKKAAEIGEVVYSTLTKLGFSPKSLSSPVATLQKEIISTIDLPTIDDIPDEAALYAYRCLHGGWQEAFKIGHWNIVYDYDLTSAYTYHTSQLLDIRAGHWLKSDKWLPKATYGFCEGIARVESNFSPIVYEGKKSQHTPTGEFPKYLPMNKIKHLYEYGIGKFKVNSAWYWFADQKIQPFKEVCETLFEWKQYLKGLERDVVKRAMVGLWGKMSEVFYDGELGKLFNPVWAAMIESPTQLQVSEFILSNHAQDNVLSIAVDGCMLDKQVDVGDSEAMGKWRLNTAGPAFVVSSGVGAVQGKQGKGAFTLKYDWLKSQIEANPEATEYLISKQAPVTLGNALKNNKLNQLGELEAVDRAVVIGYDLKRIFSGTPQNGGELLKNQYSSVPVDISVLQAQEMMM